MADNKIADDKVAEDIKMAEDKMAEDKPAEDKPAEDIMADDKKSSEPPHQIAKQVFKTAAARPLVTVYGIDGKASKKQLRMPDIMLSPIRADLVNFVHTNMNKNHRQPYAVQNHEGPKGIMAGHQVAAKSWGTGRAVSRVPRVKGGGTHRAGQGAYANMCRGGHMFAPTKVWRKWHRKINTNQKRYAVCSAVAASAVPALVMARGHRIQTVDEIPLVIENDLQRLKKTKAAMNCLRAFHLSSELRRCKRRYMRAGRGKSRNRRWKHRLGPLIVYAKDRGICQSVRNIRGVDFCNVYKLNLLKLAPGGHIGRLIIWTEAAFSALNRIYGTFTEGAKLKKNYHLPRSVMTNSDLSRIINSQEIQSVIIPKKILKKVAKKRNPLRHPHLYAKLNPLFDQQWQEIKKGFRDDAKPNTMRVLAPLRKKQKLEPEVLTKDEEEQMKGYWSNVFGDDKIFKSSELLAAEKKAVKAAIEAQEREKQGLDLMEALGNDMDEDSD